VAFLFLLQEPHIASESKSSKLASLVLSSIETAAMARGFFFSLGARFGLLALVPGLEKSRSPHISVSATAVVVEDSGAASKPEPRSRSRFRSVSSPHADADGNDVTVLSSCPIRLSKLKRPEGAGFEKGSEVALD